jgi:hypothetical protein
MARRFTASRDRGRPRPHGLDTMSASADAYSFEQFEFPAKHDRIVPVKRIPLADAKVVAMEEVRPEEYHAGRYRQSRYCEAWFQGRSGSTFGSDLLLKPES